MTAPEVMTVHPADETLAAFIDDRLNTKERRAVTEHLAACDECRTDLNDISDIMTMTEADNVVEMPKRAGWRVAAASLAVAAGLLVVFGAPIRKAVWGPSAGDVVAAGVDSTYRPSPGRLSVELPYKKAKSVNRSVRAEESPLIDPDVAPDVYRVAGDVETRSRDPHARGMAYLMMFKPREAIPDLREAAKANKTAVPDLAAALIASGRTEELREAVKLSEGSKAPVALWNRAMALDRLNDDRALQAWKEYLVVDPKSPWADEARRNIEDLKY
ncbi:MAG TPA: zf-HC2 domain-containing protein [Thermoanaerobaculia bacterium]|nr:zf-HC2 domain-containing protein [Thermoanaerobaculia bacterium]